MSRQGFQMIALIKLCALMQTSLAFSHLARNANFIGISKVNTEYRPTVKLYSSSPTIEKSTDISEENEAKKDSAWFPIRAQDSLAASYNTVVKAAYLRHILVETEEMADLLLQQYISSPTSILNESSTPSSDPFGDLARKVSSCIYSREDGGRVGWIDNPSFSNQNFLGDKNMSVETILSASLIEQLFDKRPKGGDIYKLKNENADDSQWHLIQVNDLLTHYDQPKSKSNTDKKEGDSQSQNKHIVNRPKLKGLGIQPRTPSLTEAKTFEISTTGCQMNVADSERIEGVLRNNLGLNPISDVIPPVSGSNKKSSKKQQPDVVVFNTCTIRDHAEQKLYDALGPIAARKRKGESVALVVAGCVAQQEGENLIKRFPEIDLVMGPQYVNRMNDLLEDVAKGHQIVAVDPMLWSEAESQGNSAMMGAKSISRGHDVRAWVNIIHGCNEHCTYCVVPGVRGVEQSRTMESILQEIQDLNANMNNDDVFRPTYKEITLLGQNIDAYGRDMVPRRTFADLLHYLNDNVGSSGIERIRYVTSHPRYFSDRVIDAVANLDKVMECFHMPFQSGDDKVLRDMRRGYTFGSYMKIIDKIKHKAPDASICGDVIVGFPGETDEAFQRTLDLMEEVKFDNLNTFAYSPRPNTEAALWSNQIPEDVKAERLQIVQRLATTHALERSERYLNKVSEVLVEDKNPRNANQVMGRTRQGRQVYFDGNLDDLIGKTVNVLVTEARPWSLMGELVS